jgi:hypothetical protein
LRFGLAPPEGTLRRPTIEREAAAVEEYLNCGCEM